LSFLQNYQRYNQVKVFFIAAVKCNYEEKERATSRRAIL
jgi:hypothetical protein